MFLLWFVLGPGAPGKAHEGTSGASRGPPEHSGPRVKTCKNKYLSQVSFKRNRNVSLPLKKPAGKCRGQWVVRLPEALLDRAGVLPVGVLSCSVLAQDLSRSSLVGYSISRLRSVGSSSKQTKIGPDSFGIVWCRFLGNVPDILVWPSVRPKSGSKSKMSGRILKSLRGPFSSAEWPTG